MPSSISFLRLLAIAFALFLLASCRTTQIPPERFRSVIRDGEKQHIIWANVLFVRADTKLENEGGRLTSDYIDILFLHNGVLYRVRLDDCIKGPQGWLMADKIIWKGVANA
ncbi:MAG: hypothetical protein K8S54_13310 [Spirochaetia bacterium]|nr:hypothetical protein [Spirochaetia bacterium]